MKVIGVKFQTKEQIAYINREYVDQGSTFSVGVVEANFGNSVQLALPANVPGPGLFLLAVIHQIHADFFVDGLPHSRQPVVDFTCDNRL